ncbi:hypothetical protein [Bacillus cereus]|uniref:hypothetical protein n=1 Tax=Bacillus cereus TaxID=1396 RepID=UPI00397FE0CF
MNYDDRFKIIVFMDNGKEYELSIHIDDFMREIKNTAGVVINGFFKIGDIYINPTHISSIERIS